MRRVSIFLLTAFFASSAAPAQPVITTVAGGGPDGIPATAASLGGVGELTRDDLGNLFLIEFGRAYRVDPNGILTVVAGSGLREPLGDGGPATQAGLSSAVGAVAGPSGELFLYDFYHSRIRRVDPVTGIIETVTYAASYGGPEARIPMGIDGDGNLYYGDGPSEVYDPDDGPPGYDTSNHAILRWDAATGSVAVVAGNGLSGFSGDGGPATSASFDTNAAAVDAAGNIFIVGNRRVRRVDAPTGIIVTVAGDGSPVFGGDGGPATGAGMNPTDVAVDGAGNLYIAGDRRVRFVDATTGIITTIAGTGSPGDTGDGGPALDADITAHLVEVDPKGNILIGAYDRVRRVDATTGIITTIAGPGPDPYTGDGFGATSALLYQPRALALDGTGNLYIAEWGGSAVGVYHGGVRRVDAATGLISQGAPPGTFNRALGVASDAAGNLLVSDCFNDVVKRVDALTGSVTVVAGNGTSGYSGDGGSAILASLQRPAGVALDPAGNLFIVDSNNNRIRRVDALTGIIDTVAGAGYYGFRGDGGPAVSALLALRRIEFFQCEAANITLDAAGNLYIADAGNRRIRRVDASTGIIRTVAGGGAFTGDGGPALAALLVNPTGVAVDAAGNLYIADAENPNYGLDGRRIRRVDAATGIIKTIAGTGRDGHSGDGGPGPAAWLADPVDLLVGPAGDLFIADADAGRVRHLPPFDDSANHPPVADAGPDRTVEFHGGYNDAALATLDAAASGDPDSTPGTHDDIILFRWIENLGSASQRFLGDGETVQASLREGPHYITLQVTDRCGEVDSDLVIITSVNTNRPPVADAGPDLQPECTSPAGATVILDGSGSSDPDSTPGTNDDIVSFWWYEDVPGPISHFLGSGPVLAVDFSVGTHSIILRVNDAASLYDVDSAVVTVTAPPPDLGIEVTPALLWPPNHQMVEVAASVTASGPCSTSTITLDSITSSEPDDGPGPGDGNTAGDIRDAEFGTPDFLFRLRAEREGSGSGRIYSITYRATETTGASATITALVLVPHDQGGTVEPMRIAVEESAPGTLVTWSGVDGALYYNVIRGELRDVLQTGEALDLGAVTCIEGGSLDLSTAGKEDAAMPPPGEAFFYLVEYHDGWRLSTYGAEDALKPRFPASGACP